MGKVALSLTSLVAAIPAAFLSYLLVMVFLSNAEQLATFGKVIVGSTLLGGVAVSLIPVAVIIFAGKATGKAAGSPPRAGEESQGELELVPESTDQLSGEFSDESGDSVSERDFSDHAFAETSSFEPVTLDEDENDTEFNEEDLVTLGDDDDVFADSADFVDLDDEPPAGKKKKK